VPTREDAINRECVDAWHGGGRGPYLLVQWAGLMTLPPPWRLADTVMLVVVLATAGAARAGYLWECADRGRAAAPLQVQTPLADGQARSAEVDELVRNLGRGRFAGRAPLANGEEETAHVAPGYYWLFATLDSWFETPEESNQIMRWLQAGLGTLTAAMYYLFARRAFHGSGVACIAGLLCALHPFWIINTAELDNGVLATFLLAACMTIGTRACQVGGPLTSLLFGLALAGLAMVRAALLPFTVVALLWFLMCCRTMPRGWFFALLGVLGFGNGLAPWTVRNFQTFGEPVPVADSALLHVWLGSDAKAHAGNAESAGLSAERRQELQRESNQARRYNRLSADVLDALRADPGGAVARRLWAGLTFLFGDTWFIRGKWTAGAPAASPWLDLAEGILCGAFLVMMSLGFLGWRWSHGWRSQARLAALAVLWLPVPYLLSHGAVLSGQRLPLDGVLLCFAAFGLGGWLVSAEPGKGVKASATGHARTANP
jgi:hypothetical protein